MKKETKAIIFTQKEFIKYAQHDKNQAKFSKMTTTNGVNYSLEKGYCYGFSYEFLVYSSINKGQEYIKQLNHLYSIVNKINYDDDPIDLSKKSALKMHANALLDYYIRRVILVQGIEYSAWYQTQFLKKNFTYPTDGMTLDEYMSDSFLKDYIKYKFDFFDKKEISKYVSYMYEMQKIKKNYFLMFY